MKVILSPAKSINEDFDPSGISCTNSIFPEETARLAAKLQKLSSRQIKNLMGVSDAIADLNYERYQNWSDDAEAGKPAGFLFTGAAYQALDFGGLSKKEQKVGQEKLRILSGLYGVLKPFDRMQPYRLEMGTKFKVTPKVTNLYKFWGDKIREAIEAEVMNDKEPVLVNAASSEYFKAAQLNKMEVPVITTIFKDKAKDGSYKVNMTYAKLARGHMTRFIIQEDLERAEDLKAFDRKGFYFSPKDSTDTEFVYLREKPEL